VLGTARNSASDARRAWCAVEPPGAGDEAVVKGPLPCKRLLDLLRAGDVPPDADVWAPGMPGPRPASSVRQLRWLRASGAAGTKWASRARTALATLLAIFELAPTGTREPGCTLVPLPRAVRLASEPAALAVAAQLLLTQDSELCASATTLLLAIARVNGAAAARFYRTGLFFFALGYVGRDLGPIAQLLAATHTIQMFQGAVDPAAWAARPVGERSILGTLLPESLLYQLEAYGPDAFAAQMTRCAYPPAALPSMRVRAVVWCGHSRRDRCTRCSSGDVMQQRGCQPAQGPHRTCDRLCSLSKWLGGPYTLKLRQGAPFIREARHALCAGRSTTPRCCGHRRCERKSCCPLCTATSARSRCD
jgi:GYF domain 2